MLTWNSRPDIKWVYIYIYKRILLFMCFLFVKYDVIVDAIASRYDIIDIWDNITVVG